MVRKMILFLCLTALCAAGFNYPISVAVQTHAATVALSSDPLHDLLLATAHADMDGSLRGELNRILNSARRNLRAGNAEAAGTDLLAYIALLEEQSGMGVAPDVAEGLIAAAETGLGSLFPYTYAGDYDRVPVVAIAPTSKTAVDWRTKGVVTGVKDQGMCNADYAFTATGASEGTWAISKGQLVSLSEQQLVDCVTTNNGCQGGSTVRALEYATARPLRGAHATEQEYPYTARDGQCKTANLVVSIDALERPEPGDEEALKSFVAERGPVSVVLRITSTAWESYTGGIFDPAAGTPVLPKYVAVLVVGYDDQGGTPYWIVKASYGTSWGMQGYALIPRGQNALGIANFVVRPTT